MYGKLHLKKNHFGLFLLIRITCFILLYTQTGPYLYFQPYKPVFTVKWDSSTLHYAKSRFNGINWGAINKIMYEIAFLSVSKKSPHSWLYFFAFFFFLMFFIENFVEIIKKCLLCEPRTSTGKGHSSQRFTVHQSTRKRPRFLDFDDKEIDINQEYPEHDLESVPDNEKIWYWDWDGGLRGWS